MFRYLFQNKDQQRAYKTQQTTPVQWISTHLLYTLYGMYNTLSHTHTHTNEHIGFDYGVSGATMSMTLVCIPFIIIPYAIADIFGDLANLYM